MSSLHLRAGREPRRRARLLRRHSGPHWIVLPSLWLPLRTQRPALALWGSPARRSYAASGSAAALSRRRLPRVLAWPPAESWREAARAARSTLAPCFGGGTATTAWFLADRPPVRACVTDALTRRGRKGTEATLTRWAAHALGSLAEESGAAATAAASREWRRATRLRDDGNGLSLSAQPGTRRVARDNSRTTT